MIKISLKFVPKDPTDNDPEFVALNRWQAIIWINADLIHWGIYAALGGDELNQMVLNSLRLSDAYMCQ